MLEVKDDKLVFTFPEVHPNARLEIEFQRTLRIPDDDNTYPLPPGLGAFPVKHVDDFKDKVSDDTLKRGGVMIPMYQSEALWVKFNAHYVVNQGQYPFAVKIAAGKRSAITANAWVQALKEKDYVVAPTQPWIDGFLVAEGTIRQFVAAPLGMGFTVEEQITQKAEFGGMQIEVYPMKREEFDKRFPVRPVRRSYGLRSFGGDDVVKGGGLEFNDCDDIGEAAPIGVAVPCSAGPSRRRLSKSSGARGMGMAAGGRMKQEIYPDPYGLEVWDLDHKSRTFIHLMNSMAWESVTGKSPPTMPPNAALYKRYNLPWFDYYKDGPALGTTSDTDKIKSVAELSEEKGFSVYAENASVTIDPKKVVGIKAPKDAVKDGDW